MKQQEPKRGRPKGALWRHHYVVDIFDLACQGRSDSEIAEALHVFPDDLRRWSEKEIVAYALGKARSKLRLDAEGEKAKAVVEKKAKEQAQAVATFREHIVATLDPELRRSWDHIEDLGRMNARQRALALVEYKGTPTRQKLFICALYYESFSVTKACGLSGVSRAEATRWIKDDPKFVEWMDAARGSLNDWYEGLVHQLAGEMNPQMLTHIAKTRLALPSELVGGGYGERHKWEMAGQVNHAHIHIDGRMDLVRLLPHLTLECKKELLAKWRKLEAGELTDKPEVLALPSPPAEVVGDQEGGTDGEKDIRRTAASADAASTAT